MSGQILDATLVAAPQQRNTNADRNNGLYKDQQREVAIVWSV
ncbi:hypothetical protein GCM10007867_32510 [Gluconobacter cerinus]|uniref:Transposase n=1 Tax=Gluconobacter cerinus TaxID=38307 RepID=A0AAV5NJC4_9PROT|nr:hypothetical protein DmGdi_32590 [Gluconobacter sp. Gdi]GLQ64401.1 hypothetical protein GCM10007867_32510 [Gluconobacter cerinus]